MMSKYVNPDMNPLYDRECEDPFVYADIHSTHSSYFDEAMLRLESLRIPSACEWYVAMAQKRLLESLGYKLEVGYPFDTGFENVYEEYLYKLGYDEECNQVGFKAYDEFMSMSEVEPEDEELPF